MGPRTGVAAAAKESREVMSVSVTMPQLGESVTEGTVTRWLKREGERVEADEPLLEVSTDKVDTEIPSPVSGTVRGITVAEDETVAVGAELAVIDEDGAAAGNGGAAAQDRSVYQTPYPEPEPQPEPQPAAEPAGYEPGGYWPPEQQQSPAAYVPPPAPEPVPPPEPVAPAARAPVTEGQPAAVVPPPAPPAPSAPAAEEAPPPAPPAPEPSAPVEPDSVQETPGPQAPAQQAPAQAYAPEPAFQSAAPPPAAAQQVEAPAANGVQPTQAGDSPYVTPLVRKLAAEHGIDLAAVPGTGVGGRIRKQDVLEAARAQRGPAADAPQAAQPAASAPGPAQQVATEPAAAPPAQAQPAAGSAPADTAPAEAAPSAAAPKALARQAATPSALRGRTEKLSRSRQIIAQRMMESLQTSAQLTTVVEADITAIARLRDRAKDAFEAREGVRLSFLPFFALATVEALKVHPALNAIIDSAASEVTYHDDEHLGIAVDTPRGLMVPVIRKAGDLNLAGLARKIADLAERTRAGRVSPDELSGGTFTLTNTGSRGALFDTPIINQPQVGILGTGTVVRRAVVVEDPALGEVVAVRSMVYLSLTYDHRLVDGADAARFLVTLKSRLEEGAFEAELGGL
jgi:pyruvate dehydrogenase E2 component (dihydrolipoamide acetyltransferase)